MNPSAPSDDREVSLLNRREAIKRTALMLGVALSPSLLESMARAQPSAPAAPVRPVHLTGAQFATVSAMADRILPRTDTPGAGDVGVPAFLDRMVGEYLNTGERFTFFSGLSALEATSESMHRQPFARLNAARQDELLTKLANEAEGRDNTFFQMVRDLTLLGYFTSEEVGKNITHYDPIPGPFRGCVPIAEVGNRAWTR